MSGTEERFETSPGGDIAGDATLRDVWRTGSSPDSHRSAATISRYLVIETLGEGAAAAEARAQAEALGHGSDR